MRIYDEGKSYGGEFRWIGKPLLDNSGEVEDDGAVRQGGEK